MNYIYGVTLCLTFKSAPNSLLIINKSNMLAEQIIAREQADRKVDSLWFELDADRFQPFSDMDYQIQDANSSDKIDTLEGFQDSDCKADQLISKESQSETSLPPKKTKRIKKDSILKQHKDFVVDPDAFKRKKEKKKKQKRDQQQKPQYPTKNLLQNFKSAHLDYLKKHLPASQIYKHEIARKLSQTNRTNMDNYTDLYNISEFRPIFSKMFAQRYLYRSMMLSRSESNAKKNHCKKLGIFESAFKAKKLTNINVRKISPVQNE